MAKKTVFVKNMHPTQTYKEEFKGVKYSIKPKQAIKMDRRSALQFLGTCGTSSIEKGIVKNLEIIENETELEEVEESTKFVSNVDGKEFDTQKDLEEYLSSLNPEEVGAAPLKDETDKKNRR